MAFSTAGWGLFTLGAIALIAALNATRPFPLFVLRGVSFLAQVLIAECAPWAIAAIAGGTAALALRPGALAGWPGPAGVAMSLASIALLLRQILLALEARGSVADALRSIGLTVEHGEGRWRRALLPRWLNGGLVTRIRNLRYAEGGGSRHLLDVYRPRDGVKGAPVLLQIHGGAWVVGSKNAQGRPLLLRMASAGWICVAINYRLWPRARFPDHLVDCKLALKWIREHIAEYGGDPSRVVVTGGSAGGHLAAMVALTQNDPAFQPGFETADTSVKACVPVYGPFDIGAVLAHTHPKFAKWFGRGVFGDVAKASPITHVRAGLPPMLVIQGTQDNLVPSPLAHSFVEKVRAAGNQNVLHLEVKGAAHAFDIFHSIRSEAVIEGIRAFLQQQVAPR